VLAGLPEKLPLPYTRANVRYGSKADVTLLNFDVRFTPKSDIPRLHHDGSFVP
jgi:hypothetical protein